MKRHATIFSFIAAATTIAACSSGTILVGTDPSAQQSTGECATNADCGTNRICGFESASVCPTKGECFAAPATVCQAYGPGCACDGTEVNLICNGLPTGYTTKPLAHTGACSDGGPSTDGGPATTCTKDADCGSKSVCGFKTGDACNAVGTCFPAPDAVCQAYGPGCACDGTEVNLICNGLPTGYATKPVAHAGACSDGGSSTDGGPATTCTKDADCGSAHLCGFKTDNACSAIGTCFPAPDTICQAYRQGCACDGTAVNVICNGLPTGYATKPLAHDGACP
jgi:hypothetical protein